MASTYTGNPASSDKDKLRFYVGDTGESSSFILTDEEIAYLLTVLPITAVNKISILAIEYIIGKLSGQANFALGDWKEDRGLLADQYRKKLLELKAKSIVGGASSGTSGDLTLDWEALTAMEES